MLLRQLLAAVVWPLLANAAAESLQDCGIHDETSMLQVSHTPAKGGGVLHADNGFDTIADSEAIITLADESDPDTLARAVALQQRVKAWKIKLAAMKESHPEVAEADSDAAPLARSWISSDGIEWPTREQTIARNDRIYAEGKTPVKLVDFVYCWAGEDKQTEWLEGDMKEGVTEEHMAGYGFNEMQVSLRALQLYAPWLNKVYLLVDGPAQPPAWIAKDLRVQMVDRCSLFPQKSDCPTKNTAACQAVAHRIPNLQEHFVYMEDDWFLLRPVQPADFFDVNGKPFLTTQIDDGSLWPTYGPRDKQKGPDMPPEHVPDRLTWFMHVPLPMLVSFSKSLEEEYADHFAFVRSHKTRFICCNASEYGNGYQEDFTLMYPAMLYQKDAGVQLSGKWAPGSDLYCECWDLHCLEKALWTQRSVTMQNCVGARDWHFAHDILYTHMLDYSKKMNLTSSHKHHAAPLSIASPGEGQPIPVVKAVFAVNAVLALAAFWVIHSAWSSTSFMPAGLLGAATSTQLAILVGLVSLTLVHVFLQHHAGSTGFSAVAAVLLVYFGRCVLSSLMFLARAPTWVSLQAGFATLFVPGATRFGKWPACILCMIPGGLLACCDAISFQVLASVGVVPYSILLYMRVVFVCVLWQFMFKRKLSAAQWLGIVVFVAAGITKGLEAAQLTQITFHSGLLVMIMQTLMSALANVFLEVLLKEMPTSTDLINTCTYAWGLAWLLIVMLSTEGHDAFSSSWFSAAAWTRLQGDPWLMGTMSCLVVLSVVTAYLLKELSNIVNELCAGLVLISVTCFEWIRSGNLGAMTAIGASMALLSLIVYSTDPVQNVVAGKLPSDSAGDADVPEGRALTPSPLQRSKK